MVIWYKCTNCPTKPKKLLKIDDSKYIEGVFVKCDKCDKEIEIIHKPDVNIYMSQSRIVKVL